MAGKGKGSKSRLKKDISSSRPQYAMRIVESATCAACTQPCTRGLRYLAAMSQPGAVGKGVPCILTRKRIN